MLHVIGTGCVARDFHMIMPWPFAHTCWRQVAAQRGDCKKSLTVPLNAIIIVMVFVQPDHLLRCSARNCNA